MIRAGDTTEETDVMIHEGDTTEETDVMIHAGDTTEETDVMICAGDTTEETDVMIRAGDTTEKTDMMIHAGDTTEETDVMIHAGDTNMETAAMIRTAGMREEDMAGDDHIKRDCPDLKRAIDEGFVVFDDRKYIKWANDLGDVSMFLSMKENVEARRVKSSKGKEPVRSQSIKITFEGDMATTPIRVATTKSARGSTSKKTDTDYVTAEKDGQRIDREEVILSPRKRGVEKLLMKSSLDEIDTVKPLRRALRQPMQCSILDEAVIIDEDLAVQVGLGLDRSYLFEIETVDGRKQQITGVCHKAAIEVQGVRVTLPVFAVKKCSSDLLLGRTWLSHVHAVTIERPDGSQTLSIKKLDGTRVMIETVEPRDLRNRAALAVGAGPGDQIKSLPISGRAVRFRDKKYGSLFTEEEGQIVEVEDLGSRLIVDGNLYPKKTDEEFGGVVSVSFLRARHPMGGYPSDTSE
ncbi:hypothetical protein CBR_g48705 [Chara braunii]|uniref:Uncharacterized protein n=1 Tax=Chara braunii TaxID=69332 RepID=A0A388K4L7_CHABU|nr:hypothetical protein CBR_g48705 [Chara braunii]|eukprot:GBG64956.1 hypothetical protein CBR_g48705 [Chara braunii]